MGADKFSLDELVNLDPFTLVENFDEGVYHVQISKGEKYSEKAYKHVLTIIDGPRKGGTMWSFRNILTKDSKEESKRGLLTDLMACGIKKDQLKGKSYDYETTLEGKKVFIHYTPPVDFKSNDPKEKYPVIKFLLPENVEGMKARYAAGATSTGAQSSAGTKNGAAAHVEQPAESSSVGLGDL